MDVSKIEVDVELAKQKYKEYLEAVKLRKSKEYNAVRRAYRALSKGYKLLDIYKAFEETGLGVDGRPKIAIVRANAKQVYFTKVRNGAARFSLHAPNIWQRHETKSDVNLPEGIFSNWPTAPKEVWNIVDRESVTNVPIIPAHITVPHSLENYYILFEVDKWSRISSTKDPFLLQRLNDNTFIILAEWDVSEVEAVVMRDATR
jgi:hypothetical protein